MNEPPRSFEPSRIRLLDPVLANQIAAGEVVERPASVLKELMENAMDAGAERITVQLDRGGMSRVSVRDDGCGIAADDLLLALARHATSKISTLSELESIASMGFRGEALPSIASVSRLTIDSRAHGSDARRARVDENHRHGVVGPASHPPGTTVEVRDLFYNTPARRRFLRSERTELKHCEQVFRRLALARMDIAMSLQHNGREMARYARALDEVARRARVERVLRSATMQRARELAFERDGLELTGWVLDPAHASARAERQYLYVNHRSVIDTLVRHAVRLAFADRIAHGTHPGWVLYLTLASSQVDVNVHPTKQSVRFHEARRVHDFVRFAVARALHEQGVPEYVSTTPAVTQVQYDPRSHSLSGVAEAPSLSPRFEILALLDHKVVVARDGNSMLLASAADLQAAHVRDSLQSHLVGATKASRPLLLPHRMNWENEDGQFDKVASLLDVLGIGVRRLDRHVVMVQRLPQCLESVPPQALASALLAPGDGVCDASVWLAPLCEAARSATFRDLDHVRATLASIARLRTSSITESFVRLDADEVLALVGACAVAP